MLYPCVHHYGSQTSNSPGEVNAHKMIRLLIADVDGRLVTRDKVLTGRAFGVSVGCAPRGSKLRDVE